LPDPADPSQSQGILADVGTDEPARLRRDHWNERYATVGADRVSWHQPTATLSLELVEGLALPRETPVLDVGGGASRFVDGLVSGGWTDVTVLDVSGAALAAARVRLGDSAGVHWVEHDLLSWQPPRRYGLWHDRAVFHFLLEHDDRARYLALLRTSLLPGAHLVMGTFAEDGPEYCSGLPVARYSAGSLALALGAGVHVVRTGREVHVTPSGAEQPFTWLVARLG